MNKEKGLLLAVFVVLMFIGFTLVSALRHQEQLDQYNTYYSEEKCTIYEANGSIRSSEPRADGLYWVGEKYYCVWVEERELSNIEKTDRHEYCHYLIEDAGEKEPFCGDEI